MSIVKPKVYWPLVISASNRNIAIRLTGSTQYTATIATGTYLSAELLRAAVQTAIAAVGGGAVFNLMAVTIDSTGHFVFTDAFSTFSFDWNRGGFTNSAVSILGFFALNYDSAGSPKTLTAPKQHSNGWYGPNAVEDDTRNIRDREANTVTTSLDGQNKFISENEVIRREISLHFLPPEKTYIADETGNNGGQAIENWWADGYARFRYWPDAATEGTWADYVFNMETMKQFQPERMNKHKALYRIKIGMKAFV